MKVLPPQAAVRPRPLCPGTQGPARIDLSGRYVAMRSAQVQKWRFCGSLRAAPRRRFQMGMRDGSPPPREGRAATAAVRTKKRRGADHVPSGPLTRPARRRDSGAFRRCKGRLQPPVRKHRPQSRRDKRGRCEALRDRQASASGPTTHSSASSPSSSSSPARILSAINPEFCRTALSIVAAISGLLRRKVLAFSRPCPMR